jgi:Phosphodiester glycosidase
VSAAPAGARTSGKYDFCPAGKTTANTQLVMTHRTIAPGVSIAKTTMSSTRGKVDVRVLSVDLAQKGVSVTSLHGALASSHYLTSLAAAPDVVAATNAMYFSLSYAAPVYPFIADGRPMVLSATPMTVAGVDADHLAEDGQAWLNGSVRSGAAEMSVAALNLSPRIGLSVFSSDWGDRPVPLPSDARARRVSNGRIATSTGRFRTVPAGGSLLVARGDVALRWLRALATHAPVKIVSKVATNAPVPFEQAYGAGTRTVAQADQASNNLYCTTTETLAARTSIAWSRSRTTLMLVTTESPKGPDNYGLDENQMSALLIYLRAAGGYALDGGTSTEMVARVPGHKNLVLEAAPHGHDQRPMPAGIGILYRG